MQKRTKICFNLNELIDRYIYAYSPNFEVRRKLSDESVIYTNVPIYEDFAKLMALINRDTDSMKKYREDLLGSTVQMNYPSAHTEVAACQKRNIPWGTWVRYDIRDRARMIAFDTIDNIVQILQRHYKMTKERQAKYKSEVNKK